MSCLVNNRVLKAHEKLYRYKAKAVVVPLASASNVAKVESAGEVQVGSEVGSEEKPAKRMRLVRK